MGVYWFQLSRLSVCGQNRVRCVSSTVLTALISYLHILSTNFRRCVVHWVSWKIPKFWQFLWICTFHSVLCPCNVKSKKLIPHPGCYCSNFWFSVMIPLDGLKKTYVPYLAKLLFCILCNLIFFNCTFSLCLCGDIKDKVDLFLIAVTLNGRKFDMLMYPDHLEKRFDFGNRLLIFLILAAFWPSETGQICDFWCILTTFRIN